MAWTEQQKDAIQSRNESLLVSAAAGSGKTAVLTERVTGLLSEGCDLSRMLIVTFTNAAAAEMKERIAGKLGPAAVRHSHISTFHKFAIDIIRRYYHVIDTDPAFSICDEYNQSVLKNDAMEEMFEDLFEKEDKNFQDFLDHYCTAKSNANAKALIFELNTFLQSLPDPESFLNRIKSGKPIDADAFIKFAYKVLLGEIKRALEYTDILIGLLENPDSEGAEPMPKLSAKVRADKAGLEEISMLLENGSFDSAAQKLSSFSFTRFAKTNDEKASYLFIEDRAEALREKIKYITVSAKINFKDVSREKLSLETEATKKPLSQLAFLCEEFDRRYSEKKRARSLLDFSDIEHYALKILDNEKVRLEIRDSFDHIFVDEYQDSNLVQDELINRIAKAGNVFLVGDVKQSIYKFRLAEPELFIARYEKYKSGKAEAARCIDLSNNFRSKGPVIDFINKTFEILMNRESVGIDYDRDARLYEGCPYEGSLIYEPKLYLVSQSDEGEELDAAIEELKAAELEALQAARIIREYRGKLIYDSKQECERPLEYSDMVILMRSVKGRGEIFYRTLEDCDIPVYIERNEGYFDTPEIQFFLNLLRIIDNFRQDVPLISVLHFPLFSFSAAELAEIRIFDRENRKSASSFADAFVCYCENGNNEKLRTKSAEFLGALGLWKKKSKLLPLADFVWQLLSESGLDIFARALPSGAQRFANLRVLADKAQSYEEQNAGGLYGFISYIDIAGEKGRGIETGQVAMLSEGSDAVRIMTIHKSKGLEFPFVLLAGLGSSFMSSKNKLHLGLHKDFGASIRVTEPAKDIYSDPPGLGIINLKKKQEEIAETIRVLYVAMTRAKDILVMSAAVKDAKTVLKTDRRLLAKDPCGAKNYLEMVLPAVGASQIQYVSRADLTAAVSEGSIKTESILERLDTGFEISEEKLPLSREEIRNRLFFDYSPDPKDLLKSKYSVSEIASITREKERPSDKMVFLGRKKVPRFIKDMPPDASARGTAYHTVMEHIPFTPEGKTAEEIRNFINTLTDKHMLSPMEADAVDPAGIAAFFASDMGKRVLSSKEVYKETPFVLKSMFEGRRVFVQGTIDCFFEEDGEYVLIDYKSSYIDERNIEEEKKRLKEEYLPQLKLYREALERIKHVKVKEASVYLFGINDTITLC